MVLAAFTSVSVTKAAEPGVFSSKGNRAANGLVFTIDYPRDWQPQALSNPLIIASFAQQPDTITGRAMLILRQFESSRDAAPISRDVFRTRFNDPAFVADIPAFGKRAPGVILEDYKYPAGYCDFDLALPGKMGGPIRGRTYVVALGNQFIFVQFVLGARSAGDARVEFAPEMKRILESLVWPATSEKTNR